jgi:hypothetical protein
MNNKTIEESFEIWTRAGSKSYPTDWKTLQREMSKLIEGNDKSRV